MSSPVPRSWTDRLSLRVRLLAIVAGLLAAALALAGLLTVTTLRAQLTAQVDEQLRQASHDIGRFFQSEGPGPGRDGDDGQDSFGSSYVAQVWLAGGTSLGPFTDRRGAAAQRRDRHRRGHRRPHLAGDHRSGSHQYQ
jgi:hypothetical protein